MKGSSNASTVAYCVECDHYTFAHEIPTQCENCGEGSKSLVPGAELRDFYFEAVGGR